MVVTFDKEYLKELYEFGKANDKKHRFQPDIVRRYGYSDHHEHDGPVFRAV